MCGICGIVDWDPGSQVDLEPVKNMLWAIRHRGPDGLGVYKERAAALGHARLSIIDLAGGAQPMANEDGSLWIAFNGEIFNYLELVPDLEARGHRFATQSDTEVILHLYEEYGPECVERMNGQFAFVIWNRTDRTVFMARDRFGIRPLFYHQNGSRLYFASEAKGLFASGEIDARLDPIALDQAFTFWTVQAPRTAFAGVKQLPAGCYLEARGNDLRMSRYWDLDFPVHIDAQAVDPDTCAEALREELVRATRLRMRADVPVGAYLSGGLDSSLTSAIVQEYTPARLNTFSVRFRDPAFDESDYQNVMANRLGTAHRSVTVSGDDIADAFAAVVWHSETPILRTAPAPLHRLSKLVRENGIKVVVTGEGADEMLAGYNIFKEAKIRRFWSRHPNSQLRPLLLARLYPYVRPGAGARGAQYWNQFFGRDLIDTGNPCYSHVLRWANTAAVKQFFSADLRRELVDYDAVAEFRDTLPEGFTQWGPLSQAQYIEVATFMTGYLLSSQGDRMAMAHGIEGRYPFLDHHVAAAAAAIPPRLKLRVLEEKRVLRRVARPLVPEEVINRPKQPYRAPNSASFLTGDGASSGLLDDLLSNGALEEAGCFEPAMVTRLVEKCRKMQDKGVSVRDDMALVGILSTQFLYRQFVAGAPRIEKTPDERFVIQGPGA